jgi:L-lactate dehydrogenase complex protein LldG
MSDSRTVVLRRIRAALAAAPPTPVQITRDYDRRPLTGPGDIERFTESVTEYRAHVHRIGEADIARAVSALIPPNGTLVVPADLPTEWTAGQRVLTDSAENPLAYSDLDLADAVLTGCALGIAVTGTIVLDAGRRQGRRVLSLLPDHHICVVFADQIVDTVPQAFAALDPSRPLTFISGPSATSDIELNRIEGVHGPRILDVLLVGT